MARLALPVTLATNEGGLRHLPRTATAAAGRRPIARPTWRLIAVGGVLVVGAFFGGWLWFRDSERPSQSAIAEYLASNVAPLPIRVTVADIRFGERGQAYCPVWYRAVLETTGPLYREIDPIDYLRAHARTELLAVMAAEALLRSPSRTRIPAAVAGLAPVPPMQNLMLVETKSPTGTKVECSGMLTAVRRGGGWSFAGESAKVAAAELGELKPAGTSVFSVDLPADQARLSVIVAEHAAFAAKVQAAALHSARASDNR